MKQQHTPADLLTIGENYNMFTSGSNEIRTARVEDHICVDRGFHSTSIYLINPSIGDKFMVYRPKKETFLDTKGTNYTFLELV
jgi:hypothetical protein